MRIKHAIEVDKISHLILTSCDDGHASKAAIPMTTTSLSATTWKCFLCWKFNEDDDDTCACCKRERSYAPKSVVDKAHAQPLAMHGLATALHPFRDEQVRALVASGLDLSTIAENGWTALHCAARLGQDDVVRNLLMAHDQATGTSTRTSMVEAASVGGWRSLHHAIGGGGHLRVVEELILSGANVDARLDPSHDGLTPLHLAASYGHTIIVDLLLQCGAHAHSVTTRLGRTALHMAIEGCCVDTTRLLCARTELVDRCDHQGMSPIQQAHLLPESPSRRELVEVLDAALRERHGGVAPRLLPAFLVNHSAFGINQH